MLDDGYVKGLIKVCVLQLNSHGVSQHLVRKVCEPFVTDHDVRASYILSVTTFKANASRF